MKVKRDALFITKPLVRETDYLQNNKITIAELVISTDLQ